MLIAVIAIVRKVWLVIACSALCGASHAQSRRPELAFGKYPVEVYKGPFKAPAGMHKDPLGEWHDSKNNLVAAPKVTFAGEYYLVARSCGTGCRHYELVNLRTGESVPDIARFDTGEPPPRTPDGHEYLTILYFKPGSRMIKAEYLLDFFRGTPAQQTCREQYFVLEKGKIYSLSKTFSFCTDTDQPGE